MLTKEDKDQIIGKFKTHEKDTGSSAIQIALLSVEVNKLTQHLQKHKKDHSSRRGLLRMVGQRRRLLKYLQKENVKLSEEVIKKLKIKPIKEKV
ncbi:MAG: 30S ribosomal protein S15 [Candidatus Kerfeldbacteria bacterium RIFCSPHIGHO2_02_FULL_42_14]|uniref:Small ribosomal subunit protein uS15 n=1 Tax=Candidatus Kerfeldbacteria bacterium RIFCSPHIGHO2_02_FULL_42_14 TaxID=1798540 RepID=A0A1G2AP77_9BACT|nr:MAG: 30S ribosomal protein S15 [Candidatus Kerfeldbacteria bacterium RIFCSPHIGHO2_02_FULL_42_14]OGY81787.1 MAG: 30S ribosomal protein S15 [Candidatus Kerfeldbacteria bacterium RIFCSPHIGHO2_12_FULL_42_13]OGY84476.1 MAG: 30S ribosomal protein S15 [Candidatus Kerfeldbacteria bacterium RIFCSPLOWO2_02_FULL_42_19]OGY87984.1 MAG: 30S ribosomal protein S15 [Candidatus Kerfeldbacteria bacterium RIFCSPLOWO2_12_FULL_43_9]